MPWDNLDLMDEKQRFVLLELSGRFKITARCHDFGIYRKLLR